MTIKLIPNGAIVTNDEEGEEFVINFKYITSVVKTDDLVEMNMLGTKDLFRTSDDDNWKLYLHYIDYLSNPHGQEFVHSFQRPQPN